MYDSTHVGGVVLISITKAALKGGKKKKSHSSFGAAVGLVTKRTVVQIPGSPGRD